MSFFKRARGMRRIDLFEATMQGWVWLDAGQRERFFKAGLKAALRLERQEFRAWLMRRLIEPPLAAPVDPASFAISKTDIALLMKSARPKKPFRNAIWITPGLDTIETWGSAVPPQTHPPQRTPTANRSKFGLERAPIHSHRLSRALRGPLDVDAQRPVSRRVDAGAVRAQQENALALTANNSEMRLGR